MTADGRHLRTSDGPAPPYHRYALLLPETSRKWHRWKPWQEGLVWTANPWQRLLLPFPDQLLGNHVSDQQWSAKKLRMSKLRWSVRHSGQVFEEPGQTNGICSIRNRWRIIARTCRRFQREQRCHSRNAGNRFQTGENGGHGHDYVFSLF
uniref:(northern house mosquito) hypothetical protein n=1 Tax=Culex pipiens TaxID=7175 RepID=A0A8D8K933_CULPI